MHRPMAVRWATTAACAAVGLLLAAQSARPAAAQGFGYAAIAVSSSTNWSGAEKGTTTEASVDNGALQYCQSKGAKDCKIYSVVNSCVALAAPPNFVPNLYGVGSGATREGRDLSILPSWAFGGSMSAPVSGSGRSRPTAPTPFIARPRITRRRTTGRLPRAAESTRCTPSICSGTTRELTRCRVRRRYR